MDTLTAIATRRTIRNYLEKPVEFEKLGHILDAGRFTPSAGNLQDWKFILITEQKTREALAGACVEQYWASKAPIMIVVCTDPDKTKRFYGNLGEKYSMQTGAAVIQNMLLAAHDQGLGSAWVGAFQDDKVKQILGIPDTVIVHGILPVGYSAERPAMPQRFTLDQTTYVESWGSRIKDIAVYMEWYGEHVTRAFQKAKEAVEKLARRI